VVRVRAFLAAVAMVPSLASAATPIHLAPSTPWVLDYAENSCRLLRRFGQGNDSTTLAFESEAPDSLDLLIIGQPLKTGRDEVAVKFLPSRSTAMTGRVDETREGKVPSVLINGVQQVSDDFVAAAKKRRSGLKVNADTMRFEEKAAYRAERGAFAANTTAVEIDARRNSPVVLDTGSLGQAIKSFDQCSRDSLRDWGVDPDLEDRIVKPARSDVRQWFSPDDYPKDMLARGQESVVKVRVLVDATGRVTKCTTISHFNAPEFDRITCAKFVQRVHFKPAELADGTKVPSYYVNKVIFRIGF